MAFDRAAALQLVLEGTFGDPIRIAEGRERVTPEVASDQPRLLLDAPEQESLFPGLGLNERRRVIADQVVEEARSLAGRHDFFHWEVAFPNVWSDLAADEPTGGFDAVIGNPPYVRQELLGDDVKRALRTAYEAYDGMADLYVYFYEQGLRLLRPGGRMGYVVTNKWLKANYAEALRALFAERGWLDFVADFGHVKHFFPDADVFPSVLVVRKPLSAAPVPETVDVCVIPRDAVPRKGRLGIVADASFPLPRAFLAKGTWVLEPKPVLELLDKLRRNGVPLTEHVGSKPYRGLLTGFNEAFLIDASKRNELVRADPACADVIKPYLRGQDIERWWCPDSGNHMIVLKSSTNQQWPWTDAVDESQAEKIFALTYPSLHGHLKRFESLTDPTSNKRFGLRHREDKGRFWWEMRSCDYYSEFAGSKIFYQEIQFHPAFMLDEAGRLANNKTFMIPTQNKDVLAVLNAPVMWWLNWRNLPHMKDEALSPTGFKMESLPVAPLRGAAQKEATASVDRIVAACMDTARMTSDVHDWLRHEFGVGAPGSALAKPQALDVDAFVAAVRRALPRSKKLTAAEIGRLKTEHASTIAPARAAALDMQALERRLSDVVNAAYGMTPADVKLMWNTAPPRMPLRAANPT